eukprot:TRINITY_DN2812_c0_g1_i1.p7 TRINITY_DN2812_c0_g1~~TRINITY_DN2812_c0_g1_i1.p7  ORF type:complete len:53 (-),score=12.01 TRINITY_DN2812_c0_g1_i1:754-912(-)
MNAKQWYQRRVHGHIAWPHYSEFLQYGGAFSSCSTGVDHGSLQDALEEVPLL